MTAKKKYIVTAALALFTTGTNTGPTKLYFYRGAPVPEDAPQAEIEHHLQAGLIEEESKAAEPAAEPASSSPARATK